MGRVESIAIQGVTMWFWSHDHQPPHFHVKRNGEWEYRVKFLEEEAGMFEFMWGTKEMPNKLKRELAKQVASHRSSLLKEWESKVNQ